MLEQNHREKCYRCMRPMTSCMCPYVKKHITNTKFVLITHPHEIRKVKNPSGRLTHLQLENSEIIEGIDFTHNKRVNELIESHQCVILYPGVNQIDITKEKLAISKSLCIFIIDTTWPRAKKIIKLSENLKSLPYITFSTDRTSQYKIKQQPASNCLSTIESTLEVLEALKKQGIETCDTDKFLLPFIKMVEYQVSCTLDPSKNKYRTHKDITMKEMDRYKTKPMTNIFYKGFDK
jgi:DTW domain-containing protein YfiP